MRHNRPTGIGDDGLDFTSVLRLMGWAVLALGAVASAAIAMRPQLAGDRAVNLVAQARQFAIRAEPKALAAAPDSTGELQRLAAAVQALGTERERLVGRLDTLERSIDLTGSVRRDPPRDPSAGAGGGTAGRSPAPAKDESKGSEQAEQAGADSVATRTEFAVDLGAANSLENMRSLWNTVRTSQPTLLEGLRPLMAIREGRKPGLVELRLVAGPLSNAGQAAKLCASLSVAGIACQTTTFEGQRLVAR